MYIYIYVYIGYIESGATATSMCTGNVDMSPAPSSRDNVVLSMFYVFSNISMCAEIILLLEGT